MIEKPGCDRGEKRKAVRPTEEGSRLLAKKSRLPGLVYLFLFPCTVAILISHFVAILGYCFHPDFSLRPWRLYTWRSFSAWFRRFGAGLETLHLEELELGFVGWELELGILHLELELGFVYVESAAAALFT